MNEDHNPIIRSIILWIVFFTILTAAIYTNLIYFHRISFDNTVVLGFYPVQIAFQGIILFLLLFLRNNFRYIHNDQLLKRVNLANVISFIRLTSLPMIAFLIILAIDHKSLRPYVLVISAISFLTDFLDGQISRRTNQVTRIGKALDSASDYFLIIGISILFFYFKMLPLWLFVLVLVRLLVLGIGLISISIKNKKLTTQTSFLGKTSIFVLMFLYASKLLELVFDNPLVANILFYIDIAVAILIFVSLLEKIFLLIKHFRGSFRGSFRAAEKPEE